MKKQWKILKSEEEYDNALTRFEEIFDAQPGSTDADEAELLALLIEKYDKEHYAIPTPDPVEAIKFVMEQSNLKAKDLVGIIGDKANVSKVLNKKKKLNIRMIKNIHKKLHIPYSVLMNDYA